MGTSGPRALGLRPWDFGECHCPVEPRSPCVLADVQPCSACPIASFRGGWEGGVWAMCPQLLLLRLGREGLRGSGEPVCDWLWVSSSGPSSEPDPLSRGHWALPWGQ